MSFGIMIGIDETIAYFENIKPNKEKADIHARALNRIKYECAKTSGAELKSVKKIYGSGLLCSCGNCGYSLDGTIGYKYCPNCGYKIIRR
jgi:rubrerythrin